MRINPIVIVILASFVIGCTNSPQCNKPYILQGSECCLDKDSNSICDADETTTTITTTTTRIEHKATTSSTRKQLTTTSLAADLNLRVLTCEDIQTIVWREVCYSNLALENNNPEWCNKIKTEDLRANCYWDASHLRRYTGDYPPKNAKVLLIDNNVFQGDEDYQFKIENLIFSGDYVPMGMILYIRQPNKDDAQINVWKKDYLGYQVTVLDGLWIGFVEANESEENDLRQGKIWITKNAPTAVPPLNATAIPKVILTEITTTEWIRYKSYYVKLDSCTSRVATIKKPNGLTQEINLDEFSPAVIDNKIYISFFECQGTGYDEKAIIWIYQIVE